MTTLPESLGGAAFWPFEGGYAAIALDTRLTQRERNAALAHELIHLERGGTANYEDAPTTWEPVAAREERWTDDESVRRLVPIAELRDFCFSRLWLEPPEPTEPWQVAEHFHVTEQVARRALQLLADGPTPAR